MRDLARFHGLADAEDLQSPSHLTGLTRAPEAVWHVFLLEPLTRPRRGMPLTSLH
jgi:hypothetical protein